MKISPLAPKEIKALDSVGGVELSAIAAGVKYKGRDDLMLVSFPDGAAAAGVLTQSTTASAPVHWCRNVLRHGIAKGLLVNSGNANAFTGETGAQHVKMSCETVAHHLDAQPTEIFIASTGVIGELLPIEKIIDNIKPLVLAQSKSNWLASAKAIMTTDTFAKTATETTSIGEQVVKINGFAKGSGMIEPNMATMLAFVFTDAEIPSGMLQELLNEANEETFNAITVDSDTSTSDTCLLFATGSAKNTIPQSVEDTLLDDFRHSLSDLMRDLATQVIKDGEGASKFIQVRVAGAQSKKDARLVAKTIANSPLVKTAIAGEDANWGRVVMAVGKSGILVDPHRLAVSFGGVQITQGGEVADNYDESQTTQHLKGSNIQLDVNLGMGEHESIVWTCDLTHDYISINADYRS